MEQQWSSSEVGLLGGAAEEQRSGRVAAEQKLGKVVCENVAR